MKTLLTALTLSFFITISFSQDYQDDCNDSLIIPDLVHLAGDGINESFYVRFACPTEEFEITIYDRWGAEIFVSDNHQFSWHGKDKDDRLVKAGTYIYRFEYTFNGAKVSRTGNVSIAL